MGCLSIQRQVSFYWGYLNVDGEIHKKSLKTKDKKEAEKLLFDWKNELLYIESLNDLNEKLDMDVKDKPLVDNTRRKALMITSSLMGAVTVAGFAVPFLSAWNPSEKAKALGASVKFDLSKLSLVLWQLLSGEEHQFLLYIKHRKL